MVFNISDLFVHNRELNEVPWLPGKFQYLRLFAGEFLSLVSLVGGGGATYPEHISDIKKNGEIELRLRSV